MAIHVSLDDAKLQHFITHTGAKHQRYVADGVKYGIWQETGTVRQGYAQPFMRPAVEAVRPGWETAFTNKLTDDDVEGVVVKTAGNVEEIAKYHAPIDTGALQSSIHVSEDMPGGGGGLFFTLDVPWFGGD